MKTSLDRDISHVSLKFAARETERENIWKPVCDLSCLFLCIFFLAIPSQCPLLSSILPMSITLFRVL